VSKPNEWSRTVGAETRRIEAEALTETKRMQLAFWEKLNAELQSHPVIRPQTARPRHYMQWSIGRTGVLLMATLQAQRNEIGVEVFLSDGNATAYFRELESHKDEIEVELGFPLDWRLLPDRRACRIVLCQQSCPFDSEARWPEYREWMIAKLEKFNDVFRPRVRELNPAIFSEPEADDNE